MLGLGMFSSKDVPVVGVSIGFDRVLAIMEAQVQESVEGRAWRMTLILYVLRYLGVWSEP